MVNIRSAASVTPFIVSQYIPITGAPQYQPTTDNGAQITYMSITNQDTMGRVLDLSFVKSGDTNGPSNRRYLSVTLSAGQTIEFRDLMLGGGDFIWAQAGTASTLQIFITGNEFSDATGAVAAGVRTDYVGTGGLGPSGSVSVALNKVSTLANRRLVAGLLVQNVGTFAAFSAFTGGHPAVACTDGPMSWKGGIDISNGANNVGSVHLFTYDNPTSGSVQSLVPSATVSGGTLNLVLGSKSYSGVDLSAALGIVSNAASASALNLVYAMSAGDVPIMAAGSQGPLLQTDMATVRHDGILSGFAIPQLLLMADLFGASALTATSGNVTPYGAVGMILKAA